MAKIYPVFLGVDSNGDTVWELPSGRWTWGDDPLAAVTRQRTFTPDRYLEKYGPVEPLVTIESHPGKPPVVKINGAEAETNGFTVVAAHPDPCGFPDVLPCICPATEVPAPEPVRQYGEDPETTGARQALSVLLMTLDGWIEGAHGNHSGNGHGNEGRGYECWRSFSPDDIRRMVNDAARELGTGEFPEPETPKEDTFR